MKAKKYIIHFIDYCSLEYKEEDESDIDFIAEKYNSYFSYKIQGNVFGDDQIEIDVYDIITAKNIKALQYEVSKYDCEIFTVTEYKTGKQYTEDEL